MADQLIDRRTLMAAGALLAALPGSEAQAASRSFPRGFRWGVSTAAHQIEGNNVNSDLWYMENRTPTTFVERSGDACDSYHRYDEDAALIASMGLNAYRFSIEWARVEPSPGQFSLAELDHYRRVMEACARRGIDVAPTFFHVSAPRWFAERGGWLNQDAPALFARYCATTARALGAGMRFAFTINEPQVGLTFRMVPGAEAHFARADEAERIAHQAAARDLNVPRFVTMNSPDVPAMTPNLIAAHEQAFAAIKSEHSNLPTGVTLNVIDFQPANEQSPYAEVRARAYGDWLATTRRAGDFVAVQTYRQIRLPGPGAALPAPPQMPFVDPNDVFANLSRPEALKNAVTYIHAETQKPIIVSENGMQSANDERRVWYIGEALAGLHEAISAGVPVLGYFHWSLLDNFEWLQGYGPKFGLVAVDRTTFARTPKPSAAYYGRIARRNRLS